MFDGIEALSHSLLFLSLSLHILHLFHLFHFVRLIRALFFSLLPREANSPAMHACRWAGSDNVIYRLVWVWERAPSKIEFGAFWQYHEKG